MVFRYFAGIVYLLNLCLGCMQSAKTKLGWADTGVTWELWLISTALNHDNEDEGKLLIRLSGSFKPFALTDGANNMFQLILRGFSILYSWCLINMTEHVGLAYGQ